jgi:hypothetical protein
LLSQCIRSALAIFAQTAASNLRDPIRVIDLTTICKVNVTKKIREFCLMSTIRSEQKLYRSSLRGKNDLGVKRILATEKTRLQSEPVPKSWSAVRYPRQNAQRANHGGQRVVD